MSKITICEGDIILTSKKDTIFHTFDGDIICRAGEKNDWNGEQGTEIGGYIDTPKIEENLKIEYYRFNPLSLFNKLYGSAVNDIYKRREEWGAEKPIIEKGRSFDPYTIVYRSLNSNEKDKLAIPILQKMYFGIAIHHSGNSNHYTMQGVQKEHMNENKRADIGYHFGIDKNGYIYEGRYIGVKGSHLDLYNTGVIGIVFLADLDHEYFWDFNGDDQMTTPMLKSAIILIETLKEQFTNIIH